MVQTIKPTKKNINPKSLQKQHGYKNNILLNNINNIYIKSKPSFKTIHVLRVRNTTYTKTTVYQTHSNNKYPKI